MKREQSLRLFVCLAALFTSTAWAAPCWLYSPVTDSRVGYIGVASNLDVNGQLAVAHSRQAALRRAQVVLAPHESQSPLTDEQLASNHISIAGKDFYFSREFETSGAVFSYLSTDADANAKCPAIRCSAARCEPKWLCRQTRSNAGAEVLGVGEWKISAKQQWLDAAKSAGEIAAYWGLTDVSSDYRLLRANSAKQFYNFFEHNIVVNPYNSKLPHLTLKNSCVDGSRLYQRWVFAGEDQHLGEKRAAGGALTGTSRVSGYTSQGSLQSVIDLAIRRAYADLAQNKKVTVSAIQKQSDGAHVSGYSLEAVQLSSQLRISANIIELAVTPRVGKPHVVSVILQETLAD